MSRERLINAFNLLAEAAAMVAIELEASDSSAPARADVPAAGERALPPAPAAPNESGPLGMCPVHRVAWTVKAGGISKNGKPYPAFWKCSERDADGYCNQKPTRGWSDSHPIPLEAVA